MTQTHGNARVLLVAVLCVAAAYSSFAISRARTERRIVASIERAGGRVNFDYQYTLKTDDPAMPRDGHARVRRLGLEALLLTEEKSVDLRDISVDTELLRSVCLLRGLRLLEVGPIVPRTSLQYVKYAYQLRGLTLTGPSVTDGDLEVLSGLNHLRYLSLTNTRITGQGLRHLARLPSLTDLDLEGSSISDEGLKSLGVLKRIEVLDLNNTQIGDMGLEKLTSLANLRMLYLLNTNVSADGIRQLAKRLPQCYFVSFEEWEE